MAEQNKSKFKNICVFCGSSLGNDEIYREEATNLGKELALRGINLIYGGGSLGLMGTIAQTVQNSGGEVLGITPKMLAPITGNTIGNLLVVKDMHARKAAMLERADAFIALPGGYGTMEELFEVLSWAQLQIHQKPIGIVNIGGFYDLIQSALNDMVEKQFLASNHRAILLSAPTAKELLEKLENKS